MSTSPQQLAVPPVEALLSEVTATLLVAAGVYLEPAESRREPDLAAAQTAIDVAAAAFERIAPRLRPDERSALGAMLTDVRMTVVRKRG